MPQINNDVFEGAAGHLFLTGGTNAVQQLFSRSPSEQKELCDKWEQLLLERAQDAEARQIRYLHCFIPDKLSVLREDAIEISRTMSFPAEMIENEHHATLSRTMVPLTAFLRKQAKTYSIFHQTDTHWTVEGCFSAYQMLCYYMELPVNPELIRRPRPAKHGFWDLGSKTTPQRPELIEFGRFAIGATRSFANELVTARENGVLKNGQELHVGSMVRYDNASPSVSPRRLLIFGDSFCEYRPHMLTGMFAETVQEVTFVWSSSVDWQLVDEYKPDIILTEIAERFMSTLPADNIDIRLHAANKLARARDAGDSA